MFSETKTVDISHSTENNISNILLCEQNEYNNLLYKHKCYIEFLATDSFTCENIICCKTHCHGRFIVFH